MPSSAKAVANYFLTRGLAEGVRLTPMKLQKLVYFAHGWHLGLSGEPLVDDAVEAWPYGPVFPTLYHEFKHYGNSSVTRLATDVEWPNADSPNPYLVREYEPAVEGGDSEFTAGVLNRIWEGYGPLDAIQLSNMTHEPGTPWDRVNAENPGGIKRGTVIPIEYLESYFGERVDAGATA